MPSEEYSSRPGGHVPSHSRGRTVRPTAVVGPKLELAEERDMRLSAVAVSESGYVDDRAASKLEPSELRLPNSSVCRESASSSSSSVV